MSLLITIILPSHLVGKREASPEHWGNPVPREEKNRGHTPTLTSGRKQEELLPDITMPKLSLGPQHLGAAAGLGHPHTARGCLGRCCCWKKPALRGVNRAVESEPQAHSVCSASTNTYTVLKTKLFQRFRVPLKCLILPLLYNRK